MRVTAFRPLALLLPALWLAGCASSSEVPITILQLNDVYEIMPLRGGSEGGLARVATIEKNLRAENPHTYMMFAGDLFSPSALGTARIDGVPLAGRQIVDVMNAVGLDFATFGNHEFDIAADQFFERLAESEFLWVSSNVRGADNAPFRNVPETHIFEVPGRRGHKVRVGLLGVTMEELPRPYVRYEEPIAAAVAKARELRPQVDVLIALTHLPLEQDIRLARLAPEVDLILGGHEHENVQIWRGDQSLTPIMKADANARSIYIHDLVFDPRTRALRVQSELRQVDETVIEDPEVAQRAERWVELAFDAFRKQGFEPGRVVAVSDQVLVATESAVRNEPTSVTRLITASMRSAVPGSDAAVFNGGSIRMDDELPAGPVTEYDVLRLLPFGGNIVAVDMKGDLLLRMLAQGVKNRGTGGYLHHDNIVPAAGGSWTLGNEPIDPEETYRIAISDYLMTGREVGLDFLTLDAPGVVAHEEKQDVRFALIEEMKRRWPPAAAASSGIRSDSGGFSAVR